MTDQNYNLRPLWDELLKIYLVIEKVAQKNGLRYFANGGTILGALRHNGFIPWDDDLDLYMPRPDYEKFIALAQKELPSGYKWVSIETDPSYGNLFGKVVLVDFDKANEIKRKSNLNLVQGVYVDIFALDGLPSTRIGMFIFAVFRGLLRRAASGRHWWGFLFGMGRDRNKNMLLLQKWYAKRPYDSCKRIGAVSPYDDFRTLRRWWFRKSWFESVQWMPFDHVQMPIPIGARELMANVFGDYMQLPSEEKRQPSHQCIS